MFSRDRFTLRFLCATLLLISLFASSLLVRPSATHAATGKNLVLVGGALADNNAAIYNKIISLGGGSGVARIGVITASSIPESQDPDAGTSTASNSRANGEYYAGVFKNTYGAADAQWIPIDLDHISNNSSQAVVDQVNSMTGFFFGGGDQTRLITCLYLANRTDSPVLAAIRAKFANGAVISGSSAGTEGQSVGPMFTGGLSYDAVRYGSYTSINSSYPDDLSYDPQGGLKLFSYGLIDAHFSERGRQGRIIRLAKDTNTTMGYGVDENTALVVTQADTSNAQMQVVGPGGVTIFDLSQATTGSGTYWSISGVRVTYLTQDDTYKPSTKTATIASWKTSLAGREQYNRAMTPPRDIFSSPDSPTSHPRQFVTVATDLFNSYGSSSNYGLTYETGPQFKVQMTKSQSAGYQGTQSSVSYISYVNLKVDILQY